MAAPRTPGDRTSALRGSSKLKLLAKSPAPGGLGQKSIALIRAMVEIVEAAQPITGRGVGYKLFVKKLNL